MREWLKSIRVEYKLTQAEIAKRCNISRSFYTSIEIGIKDPSVNVAKRIANQLSFEWTLFFENKGSLKEQINDKAVS